MLALYLFPNLVDQHREGKPRLRFRPARTVGPRGRRSDRLSRSALMPTSPMMCDRSGSSFVTALETRHARPTAEPDRSANKEVMPLPAHMPEARRSAPGPPLCGFPSSSPQLG